MTRGGETNHRAGGGTEMKFSATDIFLTSVFSYSEENKGVTAPVNSFPQRAALRGSRTGHCWVHVSLCAALLAS